MSTQYQPGKGVPTEVLAARLPKEAAMPTTKDWSVIAALALNYSTWRRV